MPFADRLLMDHLLNISRPHKNNGSRRRRHRRAEDSIEESVSDDTIEGIEIGKVE